MIKPVLKSLLLATTLVCTAGAGQETVTRNGIRYRICTAGPEKIRIVWKDGDGKQLRDFPTAKKFLEAKGDKPLLLMNGGIFEPGQIPSGLLVQEAKQLLPVNRNDGEGNFFLKPNGVFLISDKGPRVIPTGKYPPAGETVSYAVQSGPLLLDEGKIHPAFNANSDSRLHRNGVGVTGEGLVILAISDPKGRKFPNLHEFAELFRSLGCRNALFLDGDISQLRSGEAMAGPSNRFASVITVVE